MAIERVDFSLVREATKKKRKGIRIKGRKDRGRDFIARPRDRGSGRGRVHRSGGSAKSERGSLTKKRNVRRAGLSNSAGGTIVKIGSLQLSPIHDDEWVGDGKEESQTGKGARESRV